VAWGPTALAMGRGLLLWVDCGPRTPDTAATLIAPVVARAQPLPLVLTDGWKAYTAALSTCALILLNCYLILGSPRISLGGDKHAAGHHLCPLRQRASDLCDGPRSLRAAPGCATPRRPLRPHRRATVYPRAHVFLPGADDERSGAWGSPQRPCRL